MDFQLWIEPNFGVKIPRVKFCPDHDAPFDFICDYFFDKFQLPIVLANRSGGKTYDFAVLDTIISLSKFSVPVKKNKKHVRGVHE
jgi:hypothetical protein